MIFPLSAVCYRILVVCVSPGDLSGDAPKILRAGTRTVCRVRDKFSLWFFLYVFLLGIFQATRPRSSGRELVTCVAFATNFRFGFFECVSPGICEAARSNPQVRNSYRVGRRFYAPKIPVFVSVNKFRTPLGVWRDHVYFSPLSVDSRSIVGRQSTDPSTDCRPTIDRLSTDCRPTVDRLSTDCLPTVDRLSTDSRPTVDRQSVDVSTDTRPIYSHRQSTDGRPTVGAEDDCRSPVGRPTVVRLHANEGDLESWSWQEKELTVSCTSCEDERNALCAKRKAADGILDLDRFSNLSGKNWKRRRRFRVFLLNQRQISLRSATYNLTV